MPLKPSCCTPYNSPLNENCLQLFAFFRRPRLRQAGSREGIQADPDRFPSDEHVKPLLIGVDTAALGGVLWPRRQPLLPGLGRLLPWPETVQPPHREGRPAKSNFPPAARVLPGVES